MKRLKFLLSIGLCCCLVLSLFTFTANAADTRAATSSSCSLVNPPNSEITWRFDGNQVVWVTVEMVMFLVLLQLCHAIFLLHQILKVGCYCRMEKLTN